MKICLITTIFPPDIGGPATYSYEVSKRLSALGNEVHVVSYGNIPYENKDNIHIHRVNVATKLKPVNLFLKVKRARDEIVRIVRRHDIDIIYAQNPDLAGIPAFLASKKTGKPYYIKFVGDWAWETAFRRKYTKYNLDEFYQVKGNLIIEKMKDLQRKILNKAALIITPSNYLKGILVKSGVKSDIAVIGNAVEEYNIENKKLDGFTILLAGRLVAHKRFHKVIEAMPMVLQHINARLIIIGDGPELSNLKSLAEKLNLQQSIEFLGQLDHITALSYIKSSNLFVLPSLYEGMSHLLLEAMLYKTPVLVSDIPGNTSIISDKKNGLVFNPEKSQEFVDKILFITKNKKTVSNMIGNAYSQVKSKNTWQLHIENILKHFSASSHKSSSTTENIAYSSHVR